MNSVKAIISGVVFIVVAILFVQLAYLFAAVVYNNFAKDYPVLADISPYFRYLIAMPGFLLIMVLGGYLTALIAQQKVILHCLLVGLLTTGSTMWMALENADITSTGLMINLLMIGATIAGGYIWQAKTRA